MWRGLLLDLLGILLLLRVCSASGKNGSVVKQGSIDTTTLESGETIEPRDFCVGSRISETRIDRGGLETLGTHKLVKRSQICG